MRTRLVLAVAAILLVGACTVQGPGPTVTPPSETAVLVVSAGNRGGGEQGMTVAEALGHRATDDLVLVTGSLFIDPDGTARLCDAIAESFPPQCGGERIVVQGLDPSGVANLQEENGVRWAEGVTLFGSVE